MDLAVHTALHLQHSGQGVGGTGRVGENLEPVDTQFVEDATDNICPVEHPTLALRNLVRFAQSPTIDADETETERTREVVVQRNEVSHAPETKEDNNRAAIGLAKICDGHLQWALRVLTSNQKHAVELG